MRTHRRRRKGFDEERKRELRNDLRNYFINSKNLNYSRFDGGNKSFGGDNYSEAATASADSELDPQSQLERARKSGYNFGNISISPESKQEDTNIPTPEQQEDQTKDELSTEEENTSEQKPQKDPQKPDQEKEKKDEDTSAYTRYQLEQMEKEREEKKLETEKVQHLVDLPNALESDNRELGHSVKPFADPFLILKELLWMSGRQNPELDVIQRLWLVWTKWYTYYHVWFSINRDENRFLPGSNRISLGDRQQGNYQYRGIHQLETQYLESSLLQVMRWEFARKSELERQFNPMPTLSQLHGYFVGLSRRYWDSTSWQYRVNLGTQLMMQEEDDEQLQFTSEPEE